MSDLRTTLENIQRQVHAHPGSLERVLERQSRRQARKRSLGIAASAAVAFAGFVAIAVMVPLGQRPGLPASAPIDPANVARLAPVWSQRLDGAGSSAAVAADGVVYVAADNGKLYAIDAQTGEIRWVGLTHIGITTSPVVAGGTVLVHVGGRLYAFDTGCGSDGAMCQPQWSAATGPGNLASPSVINGVAYVVAGPGGLFAFPVPCETSASCAPLWIAPDAGGHVAHPPAVSAGVIWDSSSHALSAFPASCGASRETCEALIRGVRPNDADLMSGPAVADEVVYVGASDGSLYAVSTTCATGGSCRPVWRGRTGGSIIDTPLVAGERVYVGSNDGSLYAFPASCATQQAECDAVWIGRTGGPVAEQPVVANGIVYAASTDGNLYAFPESCGATGKTCPPLRVERIGALPPAPTLWANRVLYAISADGVLRAFTVDGSGI